MKLFQSLEVWFVVGSQHLYGETALKQVAAHAKQVVDSLNHEAHLPIQLVLKPLGTTADEISQLCRDASHTPQCAGVVVWLHTFSPARMWIAGLKTLTKPLLQYHTQFNAEVPWATMDMDFMNLNQTAHGGREFGFIGARMRQYHAVAVGHWQDQQTHQRIGQWMRVAAAHHDSQHMKVARFGDNMREVAVTEGDKVAAQMQFGYAVNGYALGDLVKVVDAVSESAVTQLVEEYDSLYQYSAASQIGGVQRQAVRDAAQIELGLRYFLEQGGFTAFTTTFENLYGLKQLPGLAVQRLMQDGYGFAGEGDWKTAALLRSLKVMGAGQAGGSSFMEDYTYHFKNNQNLVIGSHMLEVCPSIAREEKPLLDVQPLGIGGKADPARLIFSAREGDAVMVSLIDMGNRFRMIVNEIEVVLAPHALPKLPVAHAAWRAKPNLAVAAESWIVAGGAHHSVYSQAVDTAHLRMYADMLGIECLVIDQDTKVSALRDQINWNALYFGLAQL